MPIISLDEYAEQNDLKRLDIIKMDIEGSEYAALLGGQKTIGRFRPKLVIEYNRETALRADNSIEQLDKLIDELGYDRFTFDRKLEKVNLEKYRNLPDNLVVFNVYCFPR